MSYRAILTVPTLALALCTTTALAQDPPASLKPAPEVKQLGVFVGKWAAEGDLKPGPMGPGGKTTVMESCEWTSGGYAVICHETAIVPGMGKITHVSLMSYDAEAKNYVSFKVSNLGRIWPNRGTLKGNTWTWTGEHTMNDNTVHFRITQKWRSKDSFDFKSEAGSNADSMMLMEEGKESRVTAVPVKSASK
jgi:hypothetical protein